MPNDVIEGSVRWSGEHWINYLRRPGEEVDSGQVSLFVTRYGPAGEGIVAFVEIVGEDGLTAICTDNRDVADFIFEMMAKGRGNQWDRELEVLDAHFTRGGDIRNDPSWTIETGDHRIVSRWHITDPEVIHHGPVPSGVAGVDIFSLLFFTYDATITHNGTSIDGKPYTRDIWRPTIGGDRSSCVFALAETTIELAG